MQLNIRVSEAVEKTRQDHNLGREEGSAFGPQGVGFLVLEEKEKTGQKAQKAARDPASGHKGKRYGRACAVG